jgi:hypothetical protein
MPMPFWLSVATMTHSAPEAEGVGDMPILV